MVDVAIIGGGPAGSTAASLLKKYQPDLSVLVLEADRFPREHIGESQLPPIGEILHEMGAWDKVEAANFPIKIGGTYRWGQTDELWDFEFLDLQHVVNEPRPAPFAGWRTRTALQVDRFIYDKILLDHAESLGAEVRQGVKVTKVEHVNQVVQSLTTSDGQTIEAKHYIDASGGAAVLRRALGVDCDIPDVLKNIAIWDYWQNADWAVEIGVGGTRIQIMSLEYGWIWFIPLGPTRTSVGLVLPADYYKKSGESPEEIYRRAISEEPRIAALMTNATSEGLLQATKDWSFVAKQTAGKNWFLAGESAGFADPILSAGMTLAQVGAREAAYTILELERGNHDAKWLRQRYDEAQRDRVWQHIRFATFWYTGNGRFTELFEETRRIAKDAGYDMDPNQAFRWFASGSFTHDSPTAHVAHHGLATAKYIAQLMTQKAVDWEVAKVNVLRVNLAGAKEELASEYRNGTIQAIKSYRRDGKVLRLSNLNELLIKAISGQSDIQNVLNMLASHFSRYSQHPSDIQERMVRSIEALEALLLEGWVIGTLDPKRPLINMTTPWEDGPIIHSNQDPDPVLAAAI